MGIMADVRAGATVVLQAVRTANPTLIGDVHSARPASLALGAPAAYVGDFRGNIAATTTLRQWTGCEVDIVLVFNAMDNADQQAAADTLAQLVTDQFSSTPNFANAYSVGEPVRIRTATELDSNGVSYPAVVITIGRITYLEGGY